MSSRLQCMWDCGIDQAVKGATQNGGNAIQTTDTIRQVIDWSYGLNSCSIVSASIRYQMGLFEKLVMIIALETIHYRTVAKRSVLHRKKSALSWIFDKDLVNLMFVSA